MTPVARVREVLRAAAVLVDASSALGANARATLPHATGLSPEGVRLALDEHVETTATDAELERLVASVDAAPLVHVVLSSNVFVGAVRALSLAFGAADQVVVKPSRREPAFIRLLCDALSDGPLAERLRVVDVLDPRAGDAVHAYGSDATLEQIARGLPDGVRFSGHGHGFGVAVVDGGDANAAHVARDVVVFDQRGCASPRMVLVRGSAAEAERFARSLADALATLEQAIPTGVVTAAEHAAVRAYLDAERMSGEVFGRVGYEASGDIVLPPVPRVVHVARVDDVAAAIAPIARWITVIGGAGDAAASAAAACPRARRAALGSMQKPPLDGPIDQRGLLDRPPGPTLRPHRWPGSPPSTSRLSRGNAHRRGPAQQMGTTNTATRTCRIARRARRSSA